MHIVPNPCMKDRTSLGIGGRAQAEVRIEHPGDWEDVHLFLEREGLRPLIVGRGSNLLMQDGNLPLCLIVPQGQPQPEVITQTRDQVVVRVGAGFSLPRLLRWLQERGLAGLEGLAGIPASVGGAMAMNAGSFGQCLGDCLHRVRCWSPATGLIWLQRSDVDLAYRFFQPRGLAGQWFIQEVELGLVPSEAGRLRERLRGFWDRKRQTQPVGERTCGCTFKNPEFAAAGLLLDRCGMRGRQAGEVGFSSLHANFLLNKGRGRFDQAWELISEARSRVLEGYGLTLELEVQIIDPESAAGAPCACSWTGGTP